MRKSIMRDLEMLELLSIGHKDAVRKKFGISKRGLDSWLHRIRERRKEARHYINKILILENRNPRLKKILLSASPTEDLIKDFGEFEE